MALCGCVFLRTSPELHMGISYFANFKILCTIGCGESVLKFLGALETAPTIRAGRDTPVHTVGGQKPPARTPPRPFPRSPKTAAGPPQDSPRPPQDRPKTTQKPPQRYVLNAMPHSIPMGVGPEPPQDHPKTSLRRPQDNPWTPKTIPISSQDSQGP